MTLSSKLLFTTAILFIIIVGAYQYKVFLIDKSFEVLNYVSCDPTVESCFAYDCDPDIDDECDQTPYKKIEKLAEYIPVCDPTDICPDLMCGAGEPWCTITLCSDETLEDGEMCVQQEVTQPEITIDLPATSSTDIASTTAN